ncbi:hypothetical protein AA980_01675 [Neobacillus vireti]|nr:hypothetical protein AA980_01675 [Neobacillus vireti]
MLISALKKPLSHLKEARRRLFFAPLISQKDKPSVGISTVPVRGLSPARIGAPFHNGFPVGCWASKGQSLSQLMIRVNKVFSFFNLIKTITSLSNGCQYFLFYRQANPSER